MLQQEHELSELRFDPWAFFYNGKQSKSTVGSKTYGISGGEAIRMKNVDKLCEIWITEELKKGVKHDSC